MMAKSVENVQDFLENLGKQILDKAKAEIADINNKVTAKYHHVKNKEMRSWDFQYYRNEYQLNY